MKIKRMRKYIAVLSALLLLVLTGLHPVRAQAAMYKELDRITAYYTGDTIEVGKSVDPKDVSVTAYYTMSDGYTTTTVTEKVKEGFTILPETINTTGNNKLVVMYGDKVANITVWGKTVTRITADYTGEEVTVGEKVAKEQIEVTVHYSDGSRAETTDFTLASDVIYKKGLNTLTVIYGDKISYIYVTGKEALAVNEILADYTGDPLIVGSTISKSDISAYALYNNGDFTELKNFNISPSTVLKEGKNEIVVSFGGQSDTIEVWGLKKEVESISVRYIGAGEIVGTTVSKESIEVLATYNDGTTAQTDAFTLSGVLITEVGENVVVVFCGGKTRVVIVNGVEGFAPNYDNSLEEYVFAPDYHAFTKITLGMAEGVKKDSFEINPLDALIARRVVQRVIPTEEYIPFTISYDDDEMVTKFPMAVKVTVPYGYDPDQFGVYYTPNQTSIMAKLDGYFLDEEKEEYEFIVYEPGAYILVHEVANLLVQEIVVEEELELKTNRNYSLKPVVLPAAAENKEVKYWSSDESVATVSETGKIRTYEEGSCEIWVEATDGSGVCAIVTIEVVDPKKKK